MHSQEALTLKLVILIIMKKELQPVPRTFQASTPTRIWLPVLHDDPSGLKEASAGSV